MRITYWTTCCLEPEIEAISKEVFDLAERFTNSKIFSMNPFLLFKISKKYRYIGFHSNRDFLMRLLIPLIEKKTDINHIYAEIYPWFFFKTLTKPIILTIASEKGEVIPDMIDRCKTIIVQTQGMKKRLMEKNITPNKVRLIYPGIDISRFTPQTELPVNFNKPKILFATFPRTMEELEGRGVNLLIETAKKYPEIDFTFISRPWGSGNSSLSVVKNVLAKLQINNVKIMEGIQENVEDLYKQHTFTIIPYTTIDGGKECPRSLVESLACGVPVLVSSIAPFSPFVVEHDCGIVFHPNPEGLAWSLEMGLKKYAHISGNAVKCARMFFDFEHTYQAYSNIYSQLIS